MSKCTDRNSAYYGGGGEVIHEWQSWEQRNEAGYIIYTQGARTGHLEPFTRNWQERKCQDCGLIERHPPIMDNPALGILR